MDADVIVVEHLGHVSLHILCLDLQHKLISICEVALFNFEDGVSSKQGIFN